MTAELDCAFSAAKKAGNVLLQYFKKDNMRFIDKGDSNIVSEADLQSEKVILEVLKKQFPRYSYYSEESGFSSERSENLWVIDPLDGTNNFALGLPQFAVSISLLKQDGPTLGVIYHPFLDMAVYAERGRGAFINTKRLSLSADKNSSSRVISIIAGYASQSLQTKWVCVLSGNVKRVLTQWAPTIDFLLLSTGKIDSVVSLNSESEDQLAGLLIVKEAGGIIRRFDEKDFFPTEFSKLFPNMIISRNQKCYEEIVRLARKLEL